MNFVPILVFLMAYPTFRPEVVEYYADSFGAFPNDHFSDSDALQAAIDSLNKWVERFSDSMGTDTASKSIPVLTLYLRPGIYILDKPLNINIYSLRIIGRGAILRPATYFSPDTCGDNLIFIQSSARFCGAYGSNLWGKELGMIKDITLVADTRRTVRVGIYLGSKKHCSFDAARIAYVLLKKLTISNFPVGVLFGNHVWRTHFDDCRFYRNDTTFMVDECTAFHDFEFGENMRISNSLLSGGITLIKTGEFHFSGSSFLNNSLKVMGDASVFVSRSHFENPGKTPPLGRFVVLGPDTVCGIFKHSPMLVLTNSVLVVSGQDTIKKALIYLNGDIDRGLILENVHLPKSPYYHPEISDTIRVLVKGNGPLTHHDLRAYPGWGDHYLISNFTNLLNNGGAERNTEFWVTNDSVEISKKSYYGAYSFKLRPTGEIKQKFAIHSPGYVVFGLWGRMERLRSKGKIDSVFIDVKFITQPSGDTLEYHPCFKTDDWTFWSPPYFYIPSNVYEGMLVINNNSVESVLLDEIIINKF